MSRTFGLYIIIILLSISFLKISQNGAIFSGLVLFLEIIFWWVL